MCSSTEAERLLEELKRVHSTSYFAAVSLRCLPISNLEHQQTCASHAPYIYQTRDGRFVFDLQLCLWGHAGSGKLLLATLMSCKQPRCIAVITVTYGFANRHALFSGDCLCRLRTGRPSLRLTSVPGWHCNCSAVECCRVASRRCHLNLKRLLPRSLPQPLQQQLQPRQRLGQARRARRTNQHLIR